MGFPSFQHWNHLSYLKIKQEKREQKHKFFAKSKTKNCSVRMIIITRNGKKSGRKSGLSIIFGWTYNIPVPRLLQNSSNINIQCAGMYLHFIIWFLIDYACCKLRNIWLLLFDSKSRSYYYTGASHWRKNVVAVIKNRTFYTCRLFLLTRIFQYISNWSKVFEYLLTHFLL